MRWPAFSLSSQHSTQFASLPRAHCFTTTGTGFMSGRDRSPTRQPSGLIGRHNPRNRYRCLAPATHVTESDRDLPRPTLQWVDNSRSQEPARVPSDGSKPAKSTNSTHLSLLHLQFAERPCFMSRVQVPFAIFILRKKLPVEGRNRAISSCLLQQHLFLFCVCSRALISRTACPGTVLLLIGLLAEFSHVAIGRSRVLLRQEPAAGTSTAGGPLAHTTPNWRPKSQESVHAWQGWKYLRARDSAPKSSFLPGLLLLHISGRNRASLLDTYTRH